MKGEICRVLSCRFSNKGVCTWQPQKKSSPHRSFDLVFKVRTCSGQKNFYSHAFEIKKGLLKYNTCPIQFKIHIYILKIKTKKIFKHLKSKYVTLRVYYWFQAQCSLSFQRANLETDQLFWHSSPPPLLTDHQSNFWNASWSLCVSESVCVLILFGEKGTCKLNLPYRHWVWGT